MSASSTSLLARGGRVVRIALRDATGPFAWGIAGAALYAGATILSALVLGRITDRVIVPAFADGSVGIGAAVAAAGIVLGVGVAKGIGVVGRRLGAYTAQYRLQAAYRREVTGRYLHLPIEWHRRHATGELMSNANADIEAAFFVAAPLPMSVAATLMLAVTAVLLVVTDPLLAAIGFVVGPAIAAVNSYFAKRMRAAAMLAQQARADVSEVAHESFDAAIVVKTMGREAAETARFRAESEDLRDKMIAFARIRAQFDPLMEALPNLGILAVLVVGGQRVQAGVLTPGDLVFFAYLFRLVALPIRVFGWLLGELPRAIVGYDRVERVLEAQGRTTYGQRSLDGDGGARLTTESLSYTHPTTSREQLAETRDAELAELAGLDPEPHAHAHGSRDPREQTDHATRGVHDVDLDVPAGRTVAIVGPTGSGKSTVAALLVRLLDPEAGRATVDGVDLRDLDRDVLSQTTAIVFQEPFVFDDTVAGNIDLGAELPRAAIERAARLAGAHEFVTELADGYDTRVGERGASLSGGQRQRIALARALVREPRLLVLDDATSAVDPAVEAEILANLRGAELPATVLIVAYRNGSIALADEVVFVAGGTVAARGTHEELTETVPAYRRLVTAYTVEAERRSARAS